MALKYGLVRNLNIYDLATQKGGEVISTAGDYFQAQLWRDKNLKDMNDDLQEIVFPFVWAFYALKRNNDLETYDLPEKLTRDGLEDMANHMTVYIDQVKDGSLPLAN